MRWTIGLLLASCTPASPSATPTAATSTAVASVETTDAEGSVGESAAEAPSPATPEPVAGPFNEERVQEIVRAQFDKFAACYGKGLARTPSLAGTINVSLSIDGDGSVIHAKAPKGDAPAPAPAPKPKRWQKKSEPVEQMLTDTEVVTCVEGEFMLLRFPPTGRGLVSLIYPVVLRTE